MKTKKFCRLIVETVKESCERRKMMKKRVSEMLDTIRDVRMDLESLHELAQKSKSRIQSDFALAKNAIIDFSEAYIEDQITRRLNGDGSVSSLIGRIDELHGRVQKGGLLCGSDATLYLDASGHRGHRRKLHSLAQSATGESVRKCVAERMAFLTNIERSTVEAIESVRERLSAMNRWPAVKSAAQQQHEMHRHASSTLLGRGGRGGEPLPANAPLVDAVNSLLSDIATLRHENKNLRTVPSISIANFPSLSRHLLPMKEAAAYSSSSPVPCGRVVASGDTASSGLLLGGAQQWTLNVTSKGTTVVSDTSPDIGHQHKLQRGVERVWEQHRQSDFTPSKDRGGANNSPPGGETHHNNAASPPPPHIEVHSYAAETRRLMQMRARVPTDKIKNFVQTIQRESESAGKKKQRESESQRIIDQGFMMIPCTKNTAATLNTSIEGPSPSASAALDHPANRELERRVKKSLIEFQPTC